MVKFTAKAYTLSYIHYYGTNRNLHTQRERTVNILPSRPDLEEWVTQGCQTETAHVLVEKREEQSCAFDTNEGKHGI